MSKVIFYPLQPQLNSSVWREMYDPLHGRCLVLSVDRSDHVADLISQSSDGVSSVEVALRPDLWLWRVEEQQPPEPPVPMVLPFNETIMFPVPCQEGDTLVLDSHCLIEPCEPVGCIPPSTGFSGPSLDPPEEHEVVLYAHLKVKHKFDP